MKKIISGTILLLLLNVPGWALAADVVGALMPTKNVPYYMSIHESMVKELVALGISAEVILQKPSTSEMAWKNATRKLVILGAKVIVAYGSETAKAIIAENSDVPVVYVAAYDPVGSGVVGKVTGMGATVPMQGLIENLKKISNFTKLGVLYSSEEIGSVKQMEAAEVQAKKTGAKVVRIDTQGTDVAFDLGGADAVLLTSSATINQEKNLRTIVGQARDKKIATASVLCSTCQNGVLISLSAEPMYQAKGAARMVAEILNGKSPNDIPPDNTPQVEMTVNLKEAKDLGFSIPFELLGSATVVK